MIQEFGFSHRYNLGGVAVVPVLLLLCRDSNCSDSFCIVKEEYFFFFLHFVPLVWKKTKSVANLLPKCIIFRKTQTLKHTCSKYNMQEYMFYKGVPLFEYTRQEAARCFPGFSACCFSLVFTPRAQWTHLIPRDSFPNLHNPKETPKTFSAIWTQQKMKSSTWGQYPK